MVLGDVIHSFSLAVEVVSRRVYEYSSFNNDNRELKVHGLHGSLSHSATK